MGLGLKDKVKILKSSNLVLVGKISRIANICGKGSTKRYYLDIDGEQTSYLAQNLQLIEKSNIEQPKKKKK